MKPVWFFFAAALAVFLVVRRRKLEPTVLAGGVIAVAAMAVYGAGVVHLPKIDKLLEDVGKALGSWTYLLVGAAAFFETGAFIGLIAPGETVMLVGGLIAGQGQVNVITLIAIAWVCAVAGDVTSLYLGRRLGRAFLVKHGPRVHIGEDRLRQVEGFFERHGGKAILVGRFVGLVRAVAPFLAGSSGLTLRRFLPYDVIGAGLWVTAFILLGYIFWASFDKVLAIAQKGALALATVIVVVVAAVVLYRWLRDPENRDKVRAWVRAHERDRVIGALIRGARPVLRVVRRPAMFFWNRLTPGQLGLELTTLLAVLSVAAFAFVGETITLAHHTLAPADQSALDLAQDLYSATLADVAKVVTVLGTLPVVGTAVAITALFCLQRGDRLAATALGGGLVLCWAGVHITKAATDRGRPPGALVESDGSSFPSGHAAYAIAWIAVAIVLTRALPGVASRVSLVTVAIIVAAAVGITRVYLRVHWLSDVVGGWGLGMAIYSLLGTAALVVAFVRNNARLTTSSSP